MLNKFYSTCVKAEVQYFTFNIIRHQNAIDNKQLNFKGPDSVLFCLPATKIQQWLDNFQVFLREISFHYL